MVVCFLVVLDLDVGDDGLIVYLLMIYIDMFVIKSFMYELFLIYFFDCEV